TLARAQRVRVRVVMFTVGAESVDRRDVADPLAGEVLAALAVARRAVRAVELGAVRRLRLIDRKRERRRRRLEQPVLDALDRRVVEGMRRGTGSEGSAQVALFPRRVVAGPVQLHRLAVVAVLALALVPDRRKIDRAAELARRQRADREGEPRLGRIPRVHPPLAPLLRLEPQES